MKKKPYERNPRKGEVSTLKECIDQLLDIYKLRGRYNETNIIASWEKIMGKTIASRTLSVQIRNKKMYVHLSSAPLKNELSMAKDRIILLINKDLDSPAVEEIYFL